MSLFVHSVSLLQEGGPLPGPLSNTQKWIVRGDARADKPKDFVGKERLGREQGGKGTQNCSATWLAVSGFMVMGWVSRLSPASHLACPTFGPTQGPSWWRTHLSAKMDSSVRVSGRWADILWAGVSSLLSAPPDFSRWFSTTAPCSLSGPPLTTQASVYHRAWPRWGVLINGSPTGSDKCIMPWIPHYRQYRNRIPSTLEQPWD